MALPKGNIPWNKGKKWSQEVRTKLSLAHIGKKHTEEQKRKIGDANRGQHHKDWLGEKPVCICGKRLSTHGSKRCVDCYKKFHVGENHWRWSKDQTKKLEYSRERSNLLWKNWRKTIFDRDGYKCLDCGLGGYLEPHHIIPRRISKEKLYDVNNGITLCRKCHLKTLGKELGLISIYSGFIPNMY